MKCLRSLISDQRGMASVEYSLILAFVGLVIAVAMSGLALAVTNRLEDMAGAISD